MFDGVRGVFVVVDGTSRPGSAELAHSLSQGILGSYRLRVAQGARDDTHELTTTLIRSILADLHSSLFASHGMASACYIIGIVVKEMLTVAYEGDCSCGVVTGENRVDWFTPPHCLANWRQDRTHRELASDLARHHITRSFKARHRPDPEVVRRKVSPDERLVFASDGFWAQLSDSHQAQLLATPTSEINDVDDDVTWIAVQLQR